MPKRPAGLGDVLADLVQELAAAVGGQVPQFGLEVGEVAVDEDVDLGSHGPSPWASRWSTAVVKRSHSSPEERTLSKGLRR
jgi:hypothetical protein